MDLNIFSARAWGVEKNSLHKCLLSHANPKPVRRHLADCRNPATFDSGDATHFTLFKWSKLARQNRNCHNTLKKIRMESPKEDTGGVAKVNKKTKGEISNILSLCLKPEMWVKKWKGAKYFLHATGFASLKGCCCCFELILCEKSRRLEHPPPPPRWLQSGVAVTVTAVYALCVNALGVVPCPNQPRLTHSRAHMNAVRAGSDPGHSGTTRWEIRRQ